MKIPIIERGDPLTARYFNAVRTNIENLKPSVMPPRIRPTKTAELQPAGDSAGTEPAVFTEISRSTSTERVYDPNDSEVYVDVDRIDSVTFSNGSNTMKLIFNNS